MTQITILIVVCGAALFLLGNVITYLSAIAEPGEGNTRQNGLLIIGVGLLFVALCLVTVVPALITREMTGGKI